MSRSDVARDEGFALAVVLGAIAVITAVAIGGYALASETLNQSVQVSHQNLAYQAASTGLEQEISFFNPDNLGAYPKVVTVNGTDRYEASVSDLGGGVYELVSTGWSNGQTEQVVTRFQYLNLWDMNISGGNQSAVGVRNGFNGNSRIYGALYVNGNIDWGANGRMYGGPVFVKDGTWNASGNGQVGTSTERVPAYGPVPSDNSQYYTDLKGSAPDLDVPTLTQANMDAYLEKARQTAVKFPRNLPLTGVQPVNQDATHYTVFNGDTTFNAPFGNRATDAIAVEGNTLYIKQDAVVYVNGSLTIGAGITHYYGSGILVTEDGFVVNGSLIPANGVPWDTTLIPGDSVPVMDGSCALGMLSTGDVTCTGDWLVAAVFINGNYNVPSSAHNNFRGSLICNSLQIETTNAILATQKGLAGLLAEGMPELSGFTARSDWVRR